MNHSLGQAVAAVKALTGMTWAELGAAVCGAQGDAGHHIPGATMQRYAAGEFEPDWIRMRYIEQGLARLVAPAKALELGLRDPGDVDAVRLLYDQSPVALLVRVGETIMLANQAAAHLLGVDDPAQLMGRRPHDWVLLEDHAKLKTTLILAAAGDPQPHFVRMHTRGMNVWVSVHARGIRWHGQPAALVAVAPIFEGANEIGAVCPHFSNQCVSVIYQRDEFNWEAAFDLIGEPAGIHRDLVLLRANMALANLWMGSSVPADLVGQDVRARLSTDSVDRLGPGQVQATSKAHVLRADGFFKAKSGRGFRVTYSSRPVWYHGAMARMFVIHSAVETGKDEGPGQAGPR